MKQQKSIFESDVISMPSFQLVLGDVPSPEPKDKLNLEKNIEKQSYELEGFVKRLIAYLKEEEK